MTFSSRIREQATLLSIFLCFKVLRITLVKPSPLNVQYLLVLRIMARAVSFSCSVRIYIKVHQKCLSSLTQMDCCFCPAKMGIRVSVSVHASSFCQNIRTVVSDHSFKSPTPVIALILEQSGWLSG